MATELAHVLRRNSTKSERMVWLALKPLRDAGWHFRRQVAIGDYIADIACLHAKLVIEVDGASHDLTADRDAARDEYMRARGINILRFSNDDVQRNPDGVTAIVAGILDSVSRTSNTPTPNPSPQGGGEPKVRRPRQPRTRLANKATEPRADSSVRSPSPLRGGDRGGGT